MSTALRVTHTAGSTQAAPTHKRWHDNQAARLLKEDFTLQTQCPKCVMMKALLYFFLALSFALYLLLHKNWTPDFPMSHQRNTFLPECREITVTTSHDSTNHKIGVKEGDKSADVNQPSSLIIKHILIAWVDWNGRGKSVEDNTRPDNTIRKSLCTRREVHYLVKSCEKLAVWLRFEFRLQNLMIRLRKRPWFGLKQLF